MRDARFIHPWRKHQAEALSAIESSRRQADHNHYIVLPPGAGKTHVGLETARRLGRPTVVLCPNTAIQAQWLAAWRDFAPATIEATTSRDLPTPLTVLTYQSVAVFDPDAEVDEEGAPARSARGGLLDRLHQNGRELVGRLRHGGPWTIVLDECHHLLEVWGQLLVQLVRHVSGDDPHRMIVIGLTATPAGRLTTAEHRLVKELFGEITYSASAPAVVKSGHIAPYQELAMFTEPTAVELDYINAEAERFAELVTDLLADDFGGLPFLAWCDARFVRRAAQHGEAEIPWRTLERRQPELTAAAIRLHVAGLLDLPDGARVREEHRRPLDAADWATLIGDWVRGRLAPSTDERDADALNRLRKALPSVGYQVTRRGVRIGRSPVDRVLARSAAKGAAVLDILATEHAALGGRLRALVVCDHERATAQLSARLRQVMAEDAGSARLVLEQLIADPSAGGLDPILMTARTIACSAATAARLTEWLGERVADLALEAVPAGAPHHGSVEIAGRWRSRQWVGLVTRFFEDGHSRVLIGTRGLLGEGWDAQRVNVVVDLTTATTSTAVVQLRGRGVRLDPGWAAKVANTWTVAAVADGHPKGAADYARFVAKHDGFFAPDDDGQITSGVANIDPSLSPYGPPKTVDFDALNAAMRERAAARERARDLWRVHEPYEDIATRVIRVRAGRLLGLTGRSLDAVVPAWRTDRSSAWWPAAGAVALGGASLVSALAAAVPAAPATAAGVTVGYAGTRALLTATRLLAPDRSGLPHIAAAVAAALNATGLIAGGAQDADVTTRPDGSYLAALRHATEADAAAFADALDEVLSPLTDPRYLVSRPVIDPPQTIGRAIRLAVRRGLGFGTSGAEVWHAVPTPLGVNRERAEAFLAAWRHWVGSGRLLYATSPEGAGVLASQRGDDPFAVTTAMRTVWR